MVESGWLDIHYQASRQQYEDMLMSAGIQPGWKVLDAGAGSGSYLPLLGQLVGAQGSITAIDLANENIDAIHALLAQGVMPCPVEVVRASVTTLPFPDQYFDAIWCANTVQYFKADQLNELIGEFKRALKPGGLLAIKEFDDVGLHFGPFDPVLKWHLLEAVKDTDLLLGAGAIFTVDLPAYLHAAGFNTVRFKSFTGDFQHPLSSVQETFLKSALQLYYGLAEQAGLPESELLQWRALLGDETSEHYLLNRPDFYFREVHGLATGFSPIQ